MRRTIAPIPTVEIAEWQTTIIEGQCLSEGDRRLKQDLEAGDEGRLVVDELRTGIRVAARSWVGVVRFERFEVRVVPKLAGDDLGLVQMIDFATGLDALRRSSSARTLHAEGAGLLDLISLLLAEATEAILRGGLLASYVEGEDEIPVVRGRLLADKQILRRCGCDDRIVCRFDEHQQDILENRLLAAALGRCATRVSHEGVRRRVRRQLAIFQEVCSAEDLNLEAARGEITYDRLNEHYRDAHTLAWLLLDGLGTNDVLASGEARCFAFLIDMNRLFEKFVYRLLDRLLTGTGLRVFYQHGDRSIIVNALTNQPYSRVVPDVIVEERGDTTARVAIDAKYKLYDERKLDSGDVYQSFLYAYAYGGSGGSLPPVALLVYPSSTRSSRSVWLRVRGAQRLAAAEIIALGLSIPEALDEIGDRVRRPATAAIVEAIHQGLGTARTTTA